MTKMYSPQFPEIKVSICDNKNTVITDDEITGDRRIFQQIGNGYSITLIPSETIRTYQKNKITNILNNK